MIDLKNFKPNLIPNNKKDGSFDIHNAIKKNGGYKMYNVTYKKDGCRLQLKEGNVLTRSLKSPGSKLVQERFQPLVDKCKELNISLDGEFYKHGLKFNAIFRFFSKSDVTTDEYRNELEKLKLKDPIKFADKYDNLDIDFLTTFHKDLKFWLFDGIVLDAPELTRYQDRMIEIMWRLNMAGVLTNPEKYFLELPTFHKVDIKEEFITLYNKALAESWEGLVLTHVGHEYKFGRNSLNEGTILKMKDDALEYDGVILDVMEATKSIEGTERTTNELGRSVTSKKKEDRELSGMAKGFLIEFEGIGTFTVGLKGFDNDEKKELLDNKEDYIGRHFTYTGMAPVKDFPRHAYFKNFRDAK